MHINKIPQFFTFLEISCTLNWNVRKSHMVSDYVGKHMTFETVDMVMDMDTENFECRGVGMDMVAEFF